MATEPEKIIYGGDLMFFIEDKPVAFSTNAKLEIKTATRPIASKDSGNWESKAVGRHSWSGSTDALYTYALTATTTTSAGQIAAMQVAGAPIDLVFAVKTGASVAFAQAADAAKLNFAGSAVITGFSVNASDGETATFSVTFEGNDVLTIDN